MISLKRYLELEPDEMKKQLAPNGNELFPMILRAYRSALVAIGDSGTKACSPLGPELKQRLGEVDTKLAKELASNSIDEAEKALLDVLSDWGDRSAQHFQSKADQVKELLLVLGQTAEAVGERDHRCAKQLHEFTARLNNIANLEDLSAVRVSILKTASELKSSVDRMAQEGQAAISHLRSEVCAYQGKLEEAERAASRDSLTGLRNRRCIEGHIGRRIESGLAFCVVLLDINGFKHVNDLHGHPIGDELLKQFAFELQSASRTTDVIGRWGGDEFVILLDCNLTQAAQRTERLTQWVNGEYTLETKAGKLKLTITASIGLVERHPAETLQDVIARVDAAMYSQKSLVKTVDGVTAKRT